MPSFGGKRYYDPPLFFISKQALSRIFTKNEGYWKKMKGNGGVFARGWARG
jgi:hypothetical protein